ncbi:MAG: N-acetyltransferase [Flavobacteriales bacterium]|nr:N-acetyltransferase [Flavobacteriales bacterium]
MEATFHQSEEQSRGLFEMRVGDDTMARMSYSRIDANNFIINHTAVNPSAKGTGAGKKIVVYAVDWARQHDQKILPLCPFAKAIIEKTPEMRDVLRK